MANVRENVRQNIIYYLEEQNKSKKDFADYLGVSPAAITNWVGGKNAPDIECVIKICEYFHVPISEFLTGSIVEKSPVEREKNKIADNYEKLPSDYQEILLYLSEKMVNTVKREKS